MSRSLTNVHSLPDDVLREIFFRFIKSMDKQPSYYRTPSYKHRILLSSVCRRWRGVVQSMATLWANIISDIAAGPGYPPAPLFRSIVECSNPSLVEVNLYGAGDIHGSHPLIQRQGDDSISSFNLVESLNCLPQHIHRCVKLTLVVPDREVAFAFGKIPFFQAKNLEEIQVASQCGQDVDSHIFKSLRGLTALRRLTFLEFERKRSSIRCAMPTLLWHQLVHLDMTYMMSTEEVFWLLRSCTSAVTMRLEVHMMEGYDGPVAHVSNIRALNLSVLGRSVYRSLRRVEAPKLEVFCLKIRREKEILDDMVDDLLLDGRLAWPVLDREHSLKELIVFDESLPVEYPQVAELLGDGDVRGIPVVKMKIRTMGAPQSMTLDKSGFLGWADEETMAHYGKDNELISDARIII